MKYSEKMTMGKFPINIATSLAMESLVNIHDEEKHKYPPIKDYNEYWFNLNTLYRNTLGSFSGDIKLALDEVILAGLIDEEVKQINIALKPYKITFVLYLCEYKKQLDINNKINRGVKFRRPNTPKQMDEWDLMYKTINLFKKNYDYVNVFEDELRPNSNHSKTIMQTHQVIDLLSYKNYEVLDLIESHTGKIKTRYNWHTKFIEGKDLFMIPFTSYFLRIFGDKETFMPMDRQIRKSIIDLARKCNWTVTTTYDKIRHDLSKLEDVYVRNLVRELM